MDLIEQYRSYNKTCFVLGASGESGKALVKELVRLRPFERIVLIGRRKLEYQDEELRQLVSQRQPAKQQPAKPPSLPIVH
jgi:oxidoreductase